MKTATTGQVIRVLPKTAIVLVEHLREHRLYHKKYTISRKIKADVGNFELKPGDLVELQPTRKLSKDKFFKVKKVVSASTPATGAK